MHQSVIKLILTDRKRWRIALLVVSLFATLFGLLAPFFQKTFIDHLTGQATLFEFSQLKDVSLVVLIVAAFLCLLISQGLNQLTNYLGAREALLLQRKLAEKVYSKTLELKVDTMSMRPLGEIVSLYATDVPGSTILLEQTLPQGATTFFPIVLAPIALSFLLHTSLLPTVGIMVLVSILNTSLAFRQSKFFFLFKQLAAERIALVNEWITQMRGLRILGWIEPFEQKIQEKRIVETGNRIRMVTNGQVMNSISSSMTFALNTIALASLTLGVGANPTSGEILASLWILGIFLTKPFRQMPWFFTFAFDGWTSIKRLQSFLNLQNIDSNGSKSEHRPNIDLKNKEDLAFAVRGLHLQIGTGRPILNNIDFQTKRGEFVAVVGEVGAGKSLLLLSLIRETGAHFDSYYILGKSALDSESDQLKKSFAYIPQESFVMSASLEQNVVFDYSAPTKDPQTIWQVLNSSQLKADLERWPEGLESELGERGVNLSGGQKQRVSLARAAFADREIILVDDGFSNLDVKTEQAILKSLFFGLWRQKTRILVTHRLSVLPATDRIVFMQDGRIVAEGKYEDLLESNLEFQKFTQSLAQKEATANAP